MLIKHMDCQYIRNLKVIWAAVEVFCFGAIPFGWSSLLLVYKDEGLHSGLCEIYTPFNSSQNPNTTTLALETMDCTQQDVRFNLYFTIPASLTYVLVFVGGHIWTRFGIRTIRILSAVMLWTGFAMLGFANKDFPWIILPGVLFAMSGGLLILLTAAQLANLFDAGKLFVVSTMTGLFDSSSSVALFIKLAHDNGIPRSFSFSLLLVTSLVSLLSSTFLIFPGKQGHKTSEGEEFRISKDPGAIETPRKRCKTILQYMKSPIYLMHFLWFSVSYVFLMFYFSTINKKITVLTGDDKQKVSSFTDILYYIQFGGVLTSWSAGFMYEYIKKKCRKEDTPLKRKLLPPVLPLAVVSCTTLLMPILMMTTIPVVLYILFVDMVILRSYLFALAVGFIVDIFPPETFGVLNTTKMLAAAALNTANYGLFYWALNNDNGWVQVHTFQVCLALPSILHPACVWLCCRQPADVQISGWKKLYLGPLHSEEQYSTTQLKSSTTEVNVEITD